MSPRRQRASRRGVTMIEMLVAITIMLAVFGLAVPFFKVQVRSLGAHAGRQDAQQNARFVLTTIERELRVAGVGIVDKQPLIVQADPYAVTFNADLVTLDPADPAAVYLDVDADPATLSVMKHSSGVKLPRSTIAYPESTYFGAKGLTSRAETISFWVAPDSSRPGEHIMWRRVNNATPRVVSQGLLVTSGVPVFRYYTFDAKGMPNEIPGDRLPIVHKAAIHGSDADTAASALTDSIRTLRVEITARYTDGDKGVVKRTMQGSIRIMNAGLVNHNVCGEPPLGTTMTATAGVKQATLKWNASLDETAGERDVTRYGLFRRKAGAVDWGEPFASISAGFPSYTYVDNGLKTNDQWQYAVVAQDCTPASSDMFITGTITIK